MAHCGIKWWDKTIEKKVRAVNTERFERMATNLGLYYCMT
jgi:hypothetical protein